MADALRSMHNQANGTGLSGRRFLLETRYFMNPLLALMINRNAPAPSRETVAQCAHELWTIAHRPEGRDEDFWLEAERRLSSVVEVPEIAPKASGEAVLLRKKLK